MSKRTAVIIPYRDRGLDTLRAANLMRVLELWHTYSQTVLVSSDGRKRTEQFCRSAAYNRGVRDNPTADVYVFAEADMLISFDQIDAGVNLARMRPGLVVPFTQYRYLGPVESQRVRKHEIEAREAKQAWTMEGGQSIGAVNIVSRETYDSIGRFDETFDGAWFDDNATMRAFEICAGPTNWIAGGAYHLYHRPGAKGSRRFLDQAKPSPEDEAATERNRKRWLRYRDATTAEQIRKLTCGTPALA